MKELLDVNEYKYWAKYYQSKYDWKTLPVTGKTTLFTTNELMWENNGFRVPDNVDSFDVELLHGEGWLERIFDLIDQYPKALTGVAIICGSSRVVGIDFDNVEFFQHWQRLYKIELPIVKSGNGYHAYFRAKTPFIKRVVTDYYTIQGSDQLVLPPSKHYRHDGTKEWPRRRWLGPNGEYKWLKQMEKIPVIDPFEIGLIPRNLQDLPAKSVLDLQKSSTEVKLM